MEQEKQRSSKQNSSLHLGFRILAKSLNEAGLEARIVLKPDVKIWWTEEMIKSLLYKPLEEAMYGKRSTTKLSTVEVGKVWNQLMHILGERYGVDYVPFPSNEGVE